MPTDAETLDPRYATDPVGHRTTRLLHAGLVRLDPDTLAPVPYVARSLAWTDDRTLRVTLRDDVHFHGGKQVEPADVVATIEAIRSPEVASRHARVLEAIETARVVAADTVEIHLARPHATLLTDLEIPILRADEAGAPPRPEGTLDGLGPFVVARRTHGEIELAPASGAVLPPPRHSIVIRTVHDENARALRMQAGRADVTIDGFSPTLLPALAGAQGLEVTRRPAASLTYLMPHGETGVLADVRVRRAIGLAIDRAGLARSLFAGTATPASTLIPPVHWAHVPGAGARELGFSPDDARALVASAGARGTRLTLLTSTDRFRVALARVIAQELSDVGLDVEVIPLELGTMIARLGAGDFDLATLQLPEITEPNVLRVFLHSEAIPPIGANRARVRDAELDRLLDEGEAVRGEDARRRVYAALEARVRAEAWLIPLWNEAHVTVTSARARSFAPSAEGRWLGLASLP